MSYVPNPRFALEMAKQLHEELRAGAEEAKAKASQLAPQNTGRTARSFVIREDASGIYLGNTDPFFHLTEFGSANNPPYAPLRRGVREAGLRLEE